MARLETIIDGSADGLQSAATRAIGILEGLQKVADKLKIDLFKATTVEDINSVGLALTAVTGRMNDYVNAALRGNTVWQDQQAAKALDTLGARLRVVTGNAEVFGRTLVTDKQELRAYQQAFDALLKAGIDPTDRRVKELTTNINRLNTSIQAAVSGQKNPFAGFADASGVIGNLENRLKNLREAIRQATDTRQIISLNRRLRETQMELGRMRGLGDQATGMLGRLEAESRRLRTALTFAKSESELQRLGGEVRKVEGEISRLNQVAGVMNSRFGRDGRQSFNQFGLEFGRVIQDLPYAANNFGAVGNNITRMVEVFPGYIAMLRATVVAQGGVVTSTSFMKAALNSFFTGANAWLLGISVLVTGITIFSQRQQKAKRAAEETTSALDKQRQALDRFIQSQDAATRVAAGAASETSREISLLKALYNVATNASVPLEQRIKAVKGLKQEFPRYFKSLAQEAILTGNAASAYRALNTELLASGKARAAARIQAEGMEELVKLELQAANNTQKRADLTAQIARDMAKIQASTGKTFDPNNTSDILDFQRVLNQLNVRDYPENLKLVDSITAAQEKLNAIGISSVESFKRRQQLLKDDKALQDIVNSSVAAGGTLIDLNTDKTKKGTQAAKDYVDAISGVFDADTDKGNLVGLVALEKTQQATRNRYQKLLDEVDKLEKEGLKKHQSNEAERTKITQKAITERADIVKAMNAEIEQNKVNFTTKSEAKLAELYSKAGLERIRSREQELQADKAYWDGVERNMKDWGITAAQLIELRKASEAAINEKWDAKMNQVSITYARRLNESQSQMMKRQLDTEFRERVKNANRTLKTEADRLKAQAKLQQEYWDRIEGIQQFEKMEQLANDFGEAFSRAFETSLTDGKNIFDQIYKEFKALIIKMIAQQAALKAANIFGSLLGVGNAGEAKAGSQTTFGDLVKGIGRIFSSGGSGGSWLGSLGSIFTGSGEGGKFVNRLGGVFTSNNGGGGFLRSLGSIFSSAAPGRGSGGGWLGGALKLIGGFLGNSFSSGNFPTGNFGGGNFPTTAPIGGSANFVPGVSASAGANQTGSPLVLRGMEIRTLENRTDRFNTRFNGGQ